MKNHVLITGANRGIGLEFCKQLADQAYTVFACCRRPEQAIELTQLSKEYNTIKIVQMDINQHSEIDAVAENLKQTSIDLLINNAGIYGDSRSNGLGHIDYSVWRETLETNLIAAIKVSEAFLPHLKQARHPLIAAISSQMGSIDDNSSGGSLFYRSSKAALNAAMKSLAIDLQPADIGVLTFHPGWVLTDMGGPNALIDTETSVQGMIQQIKQFEMSQSGNFIKYDGSRLPW